MNKKTLIVLVGGPCSGKSSAGKIAAKNLRAQYISSGGIAREMARYDVDMQMDLDKGRLAPEQRMRQEVSKRLWKYFHKKDQDLVILDGFPRFGEQAEWLHSEFHNINIRYACIYAPDHVLRARAKNRNRGDDGSFEDRLLYYRYTTYIDLRSRINYYIDGEGSIEECATLLENFVRGVR